MRIKKSDRRVEYTKMVLRRALLNLLAEKPLNDISVTELCTKADVNRATFYAHYESTYSLLTEIQEEFYESIKGDIRSVINNESDTKLQDLLHKMYTNKDLCTILFTNISGRVYLEKMLEQSKNELLKTIPVRELKTGETHYFVTFLMSGFIGILEDWVFNGCKETPKEIAFLITRISVTLKEGAK